MLHLHWTYSIITKCKKKENFKKHEPFSKKWILCSEEVIVMYFEGEETDKKNQSETEFEVTFTKEPRKNKKIDKAEHRMSYEQLKPKIELYQECRAMYEHLKDSYIKQDELIVILPEQLQAKYVLKSISYLADEWITLRANYIKQGDTTNKIVIDIDQLTENQIANMCAELHECIDHFIARTTDN